MSSPNEEHRESQAPYHTISTDSDAAETEPLNAPTSDLADEGNEEQMYVKPEGRPGDGTAQIAAIVSLHVSCLVNIILMLTPRSRYPQRYVSVLSARCASLLDSSLPSRYSYSSHGPLSSAVTPSLWAGSASTQPSKRSPSSHSPSVRDAHSLTPPAVPASSSTIILSTHAFITDFQAS